MSSCCDTNHGHAETGHTHKKGFDWLLWGSGSIVALAYAAHLLIPSSLLSPAAETFSGSSFELLNKMWWGVALGIFFVGLLNYIPREFIVCILGKRRGVTGLFRATLAGLVLDLCSHGILMVGIKLYERGASLGQTMAFLIASPWNSISLTFILFALVGVPWTLAFIFFSAVVAILAGWIFEILVKYDFLPDNPNQVELPEGFRFFSAAKQELSKVRFSLAGVGSLLWGGLKESRMILRWLLFGVVLASLIRTFMDPHHFEQFFGPTLLGLMLTTIAATIIEVCSEGSTPIAADLMTRANAPGNSFAFLMTGVSTDYTEIMAIKDSMKSWKIALMLPLITLPQILFIAWIMNIYSVSQ